MRTQNRVVLVPRRWRQVVRYDPGVCWRAMGAASTRRSLRPLGFEGSQSQNNLSAIALRECEHTSPAL
jgi:hypothetical protein